MRQLIVVSDWRSPNIQKSGIDIAFSSVVWNPPTFTQCSEREVSCELGFFPNTESGNVKRKEAAQIIFGRFWLLFQNCLL